MKKIKLKSSGETYIVLHPQKDKCPICDTPLNEIHFSWMMFHGQGKSSCCGAIYQLKSYHVDKGEPKDYREYVVSLDKPDRIEFSMNAADIKPLKQAIKDTGIQNIHNKRVHNRYKELAYD